MEKLIWQIFERKNSIIEQVRQQIELYDQQLASKLVIQGINPPSWLWNHEAPSQSSDLREISKQRLISELLLPQQAVPSFNNFNYNSISIPACSFDDVRDIRDLSTEVEHVGSSPKQKVATRLDDSNDELDISCSEFKRSKSRQRALELRSSAKNGSKGHMQDENIAAISYKNNTPCMSDVLRCNRGEKPDSAKYLNIQHDDDAKYEGIDTSCCKEKKISQEMDHVCVSIDDASYELENVGAVFSGQVNKPVQSQDLLNIHHEGDAASEDIKIQSCSFNTSSRSIPIQHIHHFESVDRMCNRDSFGAESSGHIKATQSSDNLRIHPEGDVESEGINIQSCEWNNTSAKLPSQLFEPVDGSNNIVGETKSINPVFKGQIDQPSEFQDALNSQVLDVESEGKHTSCAKEKSPGEAIPSQQFNHEFDSVELDICCTSKTVGVLSAGQMVENVIESLQTESLSPVAHENCSLDEAMNEHYLSNKVGAELLPSGIIKSGNSCKKLSDMVPTLYASDRDSEIGIASTSYSFQDHHHALELPDLVRPVICDISPGMMDQRIKDHSSVEKGHGKLSGNPKESESSMRKISEFIPIFSADESKGDTSGVSSSCKPLQNHDHVLESLQSASPSGIIASNEKGIQGYYGIKNRSESSVISGTSPGMLEERIENHSGGEKGYGKFSGSPTKSESSMQKVSEFVPIFSAAKSEGDISGVSSSCEPLRNLDHVFESLPPASPSGIIVSNEKGSKDYDGRKNKSANSEVKYLELHSSSFGHEGGNSVLEELKVHETEAGVPQLQSATVEHPHLQKQDATLPACGYPLVNLDVNDQANKFRLQSVSCHVTSQAIEDSCNMEVAEDNIGVGQNPKSKATTPLLKETTSSFSNDLGKAEMEDSLKYSSEQAKETNDDSKIIENRSACFLEGSRLFLDIKLNEEHKETLSAESSNERESYLAGFEENAFVDATYDGMMADQSMPVLEGFTMDTDDGESHFAGGGIDFEESSFPSSTLRQASILERLCQSASRNTPIYHFPMTYGLHQTSDIYQSVPNGLLEHISSAGDYTNIKLKQKSYSSGLPILTDPFGLNVSTPYASPSKKQWDRSTSSSGLRGQGSLNPELVCFTIEEDPGNYDETAEAPLSYATCLKSSTKRKPLSDITEDFQNPPPSVPANNKHVLEVGQTPKFSFGSHLDSAGTEANLTGAQTKVRRKLGNKFSNKKRRINDTKENKNFSVGANVSKQVTDAPKETKSQMPKCSENHYTIARVSDQQRVLRSSNIVSNISSFVPLVQQKKAAAVVTGKRDIKVKALEAAEAAKRLEEKKVNERKMKKEAWKAEKARLEQENMLQLELKNKRKEEEQKKKAAEMAARKRIREDEEKKEKEGKRRRVEEARKQQHDQEKKRAVKFEKETRHQAAGLRTHDKDPSSEQEQCTKMEIGGRKGGITTEHDDKSRTVLHGPKTILCDPKGSNTLIKASMIVGGDTNLNMVMSDLNATAEKNFKDRAEVQWSYDISPYQGSDEEDDDDNDRRKDKFVPAWASKNSLAEAIFSQQHINPDEILPPESFCSIAEVLIPRKLMGTIS
ncbi:unnamed protein product [Rhodiola kirilowii]